MAIPLPLLTKSSDKSTGYSLALTILADKVLVTGTPSEDTSPIVATSTPRVTDGFSSSLIRRVAELLVESTVELAPASGELTVNIMSSIASSSLSSTPVITMLALD